MYTRRHAVYTPPDNLTQHTKDVPFDNSADLAVSDQRQHVLLKRPSQLGVAVAPIHSVRKPGVKQILNVGLIGLCLFCFCDHRLDTCLGFNAVDLPLLTRVDAAPNLLPGSVSTIAYLGQRDGGPGTTVRSGLSALPLEPEAKDNRDGTVVSDSNLAAQAVAVAEGFAAPNGRDRLQFLDRPLSAFSGSRVTHSSLHGSTRKKLALDFLGLFYALRCHLSN